MMAHSPTHLPLVGMEVSARWKRTWKGEVIMTIVMPNDVVDTEVFVKTPRGHTGIQMDPWMSCTWRRTWSSTHPLIVKLRKRWEGTNCKRLVEGSVCSGQLVEVSRWKISTGHPDQKLDISPTTMLREPHLFTRSNNLFRTTSPATPPRHCYIKRDREEYSDGSSNR